MANTLDNLRGQVLGRATKRKSLSAFGLISLYALLAEPEVGNLQVAITIKQYILWLQISIDYAILVETADSFDQLGRVEASPALREFSLLPQVVEQFTAIQEIHNEVKLSVGLKRVVKLHDERAVDLLQDVTLSLCLNQQIAFSDHILRQHFKSEGHVHLVLLLDEVDLTERATAHDFENLEVVLADLLFCAEQVLCVVLPVLVVEVHALAWCGSVNINRLLDLH